MKIKNWKINVAGALVLMSLALAFRTTLATIPATIPYLTAEPERVAALAGRAQHFLVQLNQPASIRQVRGAWHGEHHIPGQTALVNGHVEAAAQEIVELLVSARQ